MDKNRIFNHKLRNLAQSILLIGGMSLILSLSSFFLLGPDAWWGVLIGVVLSMLILPTVSPYWLLSVYHAKPVHQAQLPQLFLILDELTHRAGLPKRPELFWVPSQTMNAFAVGNKKHPVIAITNGLLQNISAREMAGIFAHEISHIRNNDLHIMALADLITRITYTLSLAGLLLILMAIPFVLLGQVSLSILGLFLLIFTPGINALLQLGLSRVREFGADLDAARLTQDPAGLAKALAKIEQRQFFWWQKILLPGYQDNQPSILRSHPSTRERVEKLLDLLKNQAEPGNVFDSFGQTPTINPYSHIVIRRPRHRFFTGKWH